MGIDLPLIWAVIIIFGIMMYVVMDGFDLGIGILFPFIPGKVDRDVMMNTVAPVWDGNETWLVLGGAALFGAFPLAYSVVLSALYLPLILMLIGLIFRGVAFEFRFKAKDHKRHLWDKAFIGGSLAATFFQGVALGAFIDGIPVYVPYDGYVDFNRFSTADLSTIQVSKGFSSVAYGPNTLGGAINLVSRKPVAALEGDVSVGFTEGAGQRTQRGHPGH